MSYLQLVNFKISKKERDKMDASDFGDPDGRRYPIRNQEDLKSAADLIGKVQGSEQDKIKSRIISIAKRKGLELPEAWKSAKFSDNILDLSDMITTVDFSTGGQKYEQGDFIIYPDCKLFHDGDFPEKKFDMTPEELHAAAFNSPQEVLLDLEHRPTVIKDDAIGRASGYTTKWNGDRCEFRTDVAIGKWLDPQLKPGSKLSATWDRETKTLKKVALVVNPHIDDASLVSSYAAFARAGSANSTKDTRHMTVHGQQAIQEMHDASTRNGAVCDKDNATYSSKHENAAIQAVHDVLIEHGAVCDGKGKPGGYGMGYFGKEEKPMEDKDKVSMFDRLTAFFTGADLNVANPAPAATGTAKSQRETELEAQLAKVQEDRFRDQAAAFADDLFKTKRISAGEKDGIINTYVRFALDDAASPAEVVFGADNSKGSRIDAYKAGFGSRKPLFTQETGMTRETNDAQVLFGNDKTEVDTVYDNSKKWAEERNGNRK